MILIIDNYDSFTYNIYHYFGEIGANSNVYRNDKINIYEICELNPKAIILSPGPCTPNEAGICIDIVKKLHHKFPILGICLGHQSIGQAFGGNIIQCSEIIHGKVCKIIHDNHKLFKGIKKNFLATRYHSLVIERMSLNKDFEIIAKNEGNTIMGIAHKKYFTYGVQFHPESIGTEYGKTILTNFLNIINYES